jgi:hypothetical protein
MPAEKRREMTRKEAEEHVKHICEVTGFDLATAMLGGLLPTYLIGIANQSALFTLESLLNYNLEAVVYTGLVPGQAVSETAILKEIGKLRNAE